VLIAERLPSGWRRRNSRVLCAHWPRPCASNLSLWSADGQALAAAGERLPFPGGACRAGGCRRAAARSASCACRTAAGWWPGRSSAAWGTAASSSSWPCSRSRWRGSLPGGASSHPAAGTPAPRRRGAGAGDLRARVPVEGRDEVAGLATSFNRAADRIEALVGAQAHLAGQRVPRAALAPGPHPRGPGADGRGAAPTCATAWPGTSRSSTSSSASSSWPAACRRWRSSTAARRWTCSDWSRRRPRAIRRTSVARPRACVGTRGCCAGSCATSSRTRPGTARLPSSGACVCRARASTCGCAIAVPGAGGRARADLRAVLSAVLARAVGRRVRAGLALVREIARRHGGEVALRGPRGGGTCFAVELPGE